MNFGKTTGAALLMGALLVALSRCQKEAGPAERAGKEKDKAVEQTGQKIEQAGDAIQDPAKGERK